MQNFIEHNVNSFLDCNSYLLKLYNNSFFTFSSLFTIKILKPSNPNEPNKNKLFLG